MASAEVEYRCFVGGLARVTDERSLERAFSRFGKILEAKILTNRKTGKSKGFGFVTFGNEQSMRDAIEGMNGQKLDGRIITVNKAVSRGTSGGGGHYGSDGFRGRGGGGGRDGGSRYYVLLFLFLFLLLFTLYISSRLVLRRVAEWLLFIFRAWF